MIKQFLQWIIRFRKGVEKQFTPIGLFIAFVAIFLGFCIFFNAPFFELKESDNRGDFIGGIVGSLLSFSGILLLVKAIKDQQESIKISQDELIAQSKELQATRRIHHEQQFGTIFFQLLGAYGELVKSFETINSLGRDVVGKKCLEELYNDFVRKCIEVDDEETILNKYTDFSKANRLTLKQFNQSLEMVLSFLLRYNLNVNLQKKYAGFISAQLSYHEEFFLLLYLTGNSKFSKEELQNLEIFDFDPEPPFDFLADFNSKPPLK